MKTIDVTVRFTVLVPDDTNLPGVTMYIPTELVIPQDLKGRNIPGAVVEDYETAAVEDR